MIQPSYWRVLLIRSWSWWSSGKKLNERGWNTYVHPCSFINLLNFFLIPGARWNLMISVVTGPLLVSTSAIWAKKKFLAWRRSMTRKTGIMGDTYIVLHASAQSETWEKDQRSIIVAGEWVTRCRAALIAHKIFNLVIYSSISHEITSERVGWMRNKRGFKVCWFNQPGRYGMNQKPPRMYPIMLSEMGCCLKGARINGLVNSICVLSKKPTPLAIVTYIKLWAIIGPDHFKSPK